MQIVVIPLTLSFPLYPLLSLNLSRLLTLTATLSLSIYIALSPPVCAVLCMSLSLDTERVGGF